MLAERRYHQSNNVFEWLDHAGTDRRLPTKYELDISKGIFARIAPKMDALKSPSSKLFGYEERHDKVPAMLPAGCCSDHQSSVSLTGSA